MEDDERNYIFITMGIGFILIALWFVLSHLSEEHPYSISNYIFVLIIGVFLECLILFIRFKQNEEVTERLGDILDEIYENSGTFYEKIVKDAKKIYDTNDRLIHNRINYFMVAESMLLFSFVSSLSGVIPNVFPNQRILSITISIVGILITAMWYYNNRRLRIRMNISQKIREETEFAWSLHSECIRRTPSGQFVLTSLLPSIILFLWVFLLLFSNPGFTENIVYEVNIQMPFFIFIFIVLRTLFEILLPKCADQIRTLNVGNE